MVVNNIILGIILWNLLISNINYKYKFKSNKLYCGLIGYSGPEPFNDVYIKMLIYINGLERGQEATGIYSPLNGLKKGIDKAWEFVSNNKVEMIPDTLFIGHVRQSTVGNNSELNAHPFKRGNCVLAHNGTLRNHWNLLRKYKLDFNSYNVDSDILAGAIDASNSSDPLREIDGAAAILFHDIRQPDKLFVFRNDDRPLYRGNLGPNMYISSVHEPLVAMKCANIKEFKKDKFYTIEKGLIIGNPKNVKNTPYKDNPKVVTTNNTETIDTTKSDTILPVIIKNDSAFAEAKRAIGCNLRAKFNLTTYTTNNRKINLIKDKYYEVVDVHNRNSIKIWDDVNQDAFTMCLYNFVETDIILYNNYVVCMYDITFKEDPTGPIMMFKDKIYKVKGSFQDGDMSFSNIVVGEVFFAKKKYFRKLAGQELQEHLVLYDVETPCAFNESIVEHLEKQTNKDKDEAKIINLAKENETKFTRPLNLNDLLEEEVPDYTGEIITDTREIKENRFISMHITKLEDELQDYFVKFDAVLTEVKKDLGDWQAEVAMKKLMNFETETFKLYNEIFKLQNAN